MVNNVDNKDVERRKTNKYLRWIAFSALLLSIVLIVMTLKSLQAIFVPLTFAIFISFLYSPVDRFLFRFKIPVIIRILVLLFIMFFVTYMVTRLGLTSIARFIAQFPEYYPRLIEMIVNIGERLRIPEDRVQFFIHNQLSIIAIVNTLSVNQIMGFIANNTIAILSYYILTIFFTIFLLTDDRLFVMKLFQLFFVDKGKAEVVIRKIQRQLNVYILSKTFINLMSASSSATFLYFIRVDFPILSGFLIFTFGFIPEIGSVIAALFPIVFCFLKFGISWQLFATIAALLVINSTFGNYLEPKLMGYQFNLSPILVIFVLVLWGWIWGPIGMLLAVPITVILNIVFKELDKFKEVRTILNLRG